MEDQTINGSNDETVVHQSVEKSVKFMADNNNEEYGDADSHVIYAEISHESQEPIAFKRSLIPETNGQTDGTNGDNSEEVDEQKEQQKEEEVVSTLTETEPQTADYFIRMEERNVIERLSRVIDSELSIETLRVDSESVADNKEVDDPKPEDESQLIESETKPSVSELPEDTTDGSVFSRFSIAVNQETTEEENGLKVTETIETFTEYEVKTEERVEKHNDEDNHKPVVEDVVIKQNGRKTIYSSEEDIDEEEDGLPEIIGFKTTLKMWSNGKNTTGGDVPVIDSKDKFKTLRQIRKGNTRSLMEKFQAFKS